MREVDDTEFQRVMREVLAARANAVHTDSDRDVLRHRSELRGQTPDVRRRVLPPVAAALIVLVAAGLLSWFGLSQSGTRHTSSADGASQTASPPAECLSSQLAISMVGNGSAMGTHVDAIIARNTSTQDCTLQGPPEVSLRLAGSSGNAPVSVDKSSNATDPLVYLAPGQSAWARLTYSDYSANNMPASCGSGNALLVTLPDQPQATTLAAKVTSCDRYLVDSFQNGLPHQGTEPTPTFTK